MRQGKDKLSLHTAKRSYLPMARSLQAPYVRFLQQAPLDLSGACTIRISPMLWTEDRANRSDVPYSEYLATQS